jgi:hypothetical protein
MEKVVTFFKTLTTVFYFKFFELGNVILIKVCIDVKLFKIIWISFEKDLTGLSRFKPGYCTGGPTCQLNFPPLFPPNAARQRAPLPPSPDPTGSVPFRKPSRLGTPSFFATVLNPTFAPPFWPPDRTAPHPSFPLSFGYKLLNVVASPPLLPSTLVSKHWTYWSHAGVMGPVSWYSCVTT